MFALKVAVAAGNGVTVDMAGVGWVIARKPIPINTKTNIIAKPINPRTSHLVVLRGFDVIITGDLGVACDGTGWFGRAIGTG